MYQNWFRKGACSILFLLTASTCFAADNNKTETVSCNDSKCKSINLPPRLTSEHYYLHPTEKMNWFRAGLHCRMHGMKFATVETEAQNKEILDLLRNNDAHHVWVGLTDHGNEGKFYQMETGKQVQIIGWLSGQPDNAGKDGESQNCVQFSLEGDVTGWVDDSCDDEYNFLCQHRF